MPASAPRERTALILVRAWVSPGSDVLNARVIGVADLVSGAQNAVAASGVDEVCEAVRAWLLPLLEDANQPPA